MSCLLEVNRCRMFHFPFNFDVKFRRSSEIFFGRKVKDLFWAWRQILSFKINISSLKALILTNEVSMLKLSIKEHFQSDEP